MIVDIDNNHRYVVKSKKMWKSFPDRISARRFITGLGPHTNMGTYGRGVLARYYSHNTDTYYDIDVRRPTFICETGWWEVHELRHCVTWHKFDGTEPVTFYP